MNAEDFVTYEQALALKKLKFDLEVNHCYADEKLEEICADYSSENSFDNNISAYDNYNRKGFIEIQCSAPTLEQTHKWLRSKGLWIEICLEPFDEEGWEFDIFNLKDHYYYSFSFSTMYNTYEEALSAGITECIKILEKVCQS